MDQGLRKPKPGFILHAWGVRGSVKFAFKRSRVTTQGAATPHLHAFVGSGEIVIELVDGAARPSLAHGSPIRGTVTRNEVRLVLAAAGSAYDRLVALWKESQPS